MYVIPYKNTEPDIIRVKPFIINKLVGIFLENKKNDLLLVIMYKIYKLTQISKKRKDVKPYDKKYE